MKYLYCFIVSLVLLLTHTHIPRVSAEDNIVSLQVAWNNPFNPLKNETTRFDFFIHGKDSAVKLFIFAVDGRFVRQLTDQLALANVQYSIPWDGRSENGQVVASGTYFAVLYAGAHRRIQRVVVVNR